LDLNGKRPWGPKSILQKTATWVKGRALPKQGGKRIEAKSRDSPTPQGGGRRDKLAGGKRMQTSIQGAGGKTSLGEKKMLRNSVKIIKGNNPEETARKKKKP